MTARDAIEHITLTTGATRMSPRAEVAPDIIELIRDALAQGGDLPSVGMSIRLLAQPIVGGDIFDLLVGDLRMVRCWLCQDKAANDAMWDDAGEWIIDERVRLGRPRGVPWLAVALDTDNIRSIDVPTLTSLGDLERCVAWALIDDAP